jgi:hypothetical protein
MRVLAAVALAGCGLMMLLFMFIGLGETLDTNATETQVTQQRPFSYVIWRE